MKVCFKCKEEKSLSEFYKHPEMKDGTLNKCKACTKKDVSKNYRSNIEHYVNYEVLREKRPERKEFKKDQQIKHRTLNKDKYKARCAVANAIRDKRLFRLNCEKCGSPESQAHHEDYSKPLDVRWLCFSCHRAEHGQEARKANNDSRDIGLF